MIRKQVSQLQTTRLGPVKAARAADETRKNSRAEQIGRTRPLPAIRGVPGDIDQRRFLTDAFQNMAMAQVGNGNQVTNVLAYGTNPNRYRDYDPGRFEGLYAPAGEYDYIVTPTTIISVFNETTNMFEDQVITPVPAKKWKPSELAVVGRSSTRPLTTNVIQESDVW